MNDDINANANEHTEATEGAESTPRPPLHATVTWLLTLGSLGELAVAAISEDVQVMAANEDEANEARDAREADLRAQLAAAHERIDNEVRINAGLDARLTALERSLGGAPAPQPPADPTPAPTLDVVMLPRLSGASWHVEQAGSTTTGDFVFELGSELVSVPRATAGQVYRLRIDVAAG